MYLKSHMYKGKMAKTLQICRICLSVNIRMFTLKNINMKNLYKLLTQVYVDIEDGKPATVCFLCYARLRQCNKLQQQAMKSNELLEQLLKGGFMWETANAIVNNQYTSQDLQVSSTYHLDLEPTNSEDVLLDTKIVANNQISAKEEEKEAIDDGCNVTENLCLIQQEKDVKKEATPIQQKDKTSYNNEESKEIHMKFERSQEKRKSTFVTKKQTFRKSFNNDKHAKVDVKSQRKLKKKKTNVSNKRKLQKPIPYKDKHQENINCAKTSVLKTIVDEFQCNECGTQFSTKDILTDHILKCIKTTKNSLRGDQLTKADALKSLLSKKYICNICSFKTCNKRIIESHLKMHNVTKVFHCNICEYRGGHKGNFEKHMRTHTGEKPFFCNICEYRSVQKSDLKRHIRKHTGKKPFSCNICEYRSAHKYDLKRHIIIHTGEKPFSCNICEYKCAHYSQLKEHVFKHTREIPFSCIICKYKCTQKVNLKYHMITHTGEKPFSSNICEYWCIRKYNLKRHLRTHN